MSNNIDLKKGLNIPIRGAATLALKKTIAPDVVAVKPTDFKGFSPRLLVKEGDAVKAGSPVMADKQNADILLCAPVSGTVQSIVRGEKRKLLALVVKADGQNACVDFGAKDPAALDAEAIKKALLSSGLWPSIVERPYGIVADPSGKPKGIFVSAFNTAPLAADPDFAFRDDFEAIQAGITAVSKLSEGGVHVCVNRTDSPFCKLRGATIHLVNGDKHPAGNVGVQISHISPIRKGETVWTLSLLSLATIGRRFTEGKLNLSRKVAITGPEAIAPGYVSVIAGTSMMSLVDFFNSGDDNLRVVSGDALTGENVGRNGYLGFFDNQVTLLHEGYEREVLGWAKPFRFNQFSSSMAYFSWLCPKKKYDMDTNVHGGPRAFVISNVFEKVLPMDIFPIYLIKACYTGDIDKMEKFGIYEVLPEDFALCEFVDPSKNEIQSIIQKGIDLMLKEMA